MSKTIYRFSIRLIATLGLLFPGEAKASIFDTLYKVDNEKALIVADNIYVNKIGDFSKQDAIKEIKSLSVIAEKKNDEILKHYAQFLLGKYYYQAEMWDNALPLTLFKEASTGSDYPDIFTMQLLHYTGLWYYYGERQFPLAFENLLKANDILVRRGYKNTPNAEDMLCDISTIYHQFDENDKAIYFLTELIKLPVRSVKKRIDAWNTLGLCYVMEKNDDSALYCYEQALKLARQANNIAWYGVVMGNVGYLRFRKGDKIKALEGFKTDYEISLSNNQNASAGIAAQMIAEIYLDMNMVDSAKKMLNISTQLINLSSDPLPKVRLYNTYARYYDQISDFKLASSYKDSVIFYKEETRKAKDVSLLERARNKTETEAHLDNIKFLESEKNKQIWIRNSLIAMATLGLIILWQTIRKIRLRQRKDREIYELKQAKSEEDLKNASLRLEMYVESVKQKNQLIERFSNEIELLKKNEAESGASNTEKEEVLKRLQESVILTEDNWIEFRHLFVKVYPSFFIRLQESFPSLTKAEMRLMTLIKLGFSQNDMAAALAISPDSVRRTKYRLCKKLNLDEPEMLNEIILKL